MVDFLKSCIFTEGMAAMTAFVILTTAFVVCGLKGCEHDNAKAIRHDAMVKACLGSSRPYSECKGL